MFFAFFIDDRRPQVHSNCVDCGFHCTLSRRHLRLRSSERASVLLTKKSAPRVRHQSRLPQPKDYKSLQKSRLQPRTNIFITSFSAFMAILERQFFTCILQISIYFTHLKRSTGKMVRCIRDENPMLVAGSFYAQPCASF